MFFNSQKHSKRSYAQCGEDVILDFLFENRFKIAKPSYLDIGAHHPVYLSNTYYFYLKGGNGVLVEPDPFLWKNIRKKRKKDVCLNVGVGIADESSSDFFIMDCRTLNTFSREDAERYQAHDNHKIEKVISIPLLPVNKIIEEHFAQTPNFVSVDVEGLDLDVLTSFDFSRYRPEAFCVETLTYTKDFTGVKTPEIMDFMLKNNYFVYADTYINTIFVDKKAWERRA